jgi:carbon starvation protein
MVTAFYLWRRNKRVLFVLLPMLMMLFMPAWAMLWQMFNADSGWLWSGKYVLFSFGLAVMCLQVWMVIEALLLFPRTRGVLEQSLPPLDQESGLKPGLAGTGGRAC